jgi:release factor glutamine methyltransferase
VNSIKNISNHISTCLSDVKIENPQMEARIILAHYLDCSIEKLIIDQDKLIEYSKELENLVNQRLKKIPLAYILGYKEFYGRRFFVNQNVLIPRPDTETLIDSVLKKYSNINNLNLLELGVGSGCIIINILLGLKNSRAIGIDISEQALDIALKNIKLHNCQNRIELLLSNWYSNIKALKQFDVIISNPPYIRKNEIDLMSEETIRYEPMIALYDEYFDSYKQIAKHSKNYLKENGEIYLEIGMNQEIEITNIFLAENYILKNEFYDLSNILRVLVFSISN